MIKRDQYIYDEYEEKIGKNFGDYEYTKRALKNTAKGRMRVIYGNEIINVE